MTPPKPHRKRTLQQFLTLLSAPNDGDNARSLPRIVGTVALLVVLALLALQTIAGRLVDALGLPQIPVAWLMGAFVGISIVWAGLTAWRKHRKDRADD